MEGFPNRPIVELIRDRQVEGGTLTRIDGRGLDLGACGVQRSGVQPWRAWARRS
jgi:hypothetical protein